VAAYLGDETSQGDIGQILGMIVDTAWVPLKGFQKQLGVCSRHAAVVPSTTPASNSPQWMFDGRGK
jgi:hypothetical protein